MHPGRIACAERAPWPNNVRLVCAERAPYLSVLSCTIVNFSVALVHNLRILQFHVWSGGFCESRAGDQLRPRSGPPRAADGRRRRHTRRPPRCAQLQRPQAGPVHQRGLSIFHRSWVSWIVLATGTGRWLWARPARARTAPSWHYGSLWAPAISSMSSHATALRYPRFLSLPTCRPGTGMPARRTSSKARPLVQHAVLVAQRCRRSLTSLCVVGHANSTAT